MYVKHRPVLSHVRVIAPLLVAVLGLSACNSSTSGAPASGSGAGSTGAAQEAKKDKVLFESDFEGVCSGAPQAAAAAYDKSQAGIHPALGFYSPSSAVDTKMIAMQIPDGFTREWTDGKNTLAEVQLVVCAKRVKDSVVKKCDGYQRDGKDSGQVVTLHNATYEVKLYAAKTGQEVAAKTIDLKADECPRYVLGDQTDEFPDIKDDALAFIQPHIKTG
ncbi:hypothetical protein SAMN05661093_08421 [Kibdelosporangium aridum]|uniref:Lipoprotein n=1 Tax=Kibdelosporangium aridum TaxID=2030 RepID=A0A1W2FQY0_KIBAR|nr:hypothetical protein SAMN05661093_08421 [Kibdelosporangium aridum]